MLDLELGTRSPIRKTALKSIVAMCPQLLRLKFGQGPVWLTPLLANQQRLKNLFRIDFEGENIVF